MQNQTRLSILKNSIYSTLGLMLFAVGVYFTIQANIGAAPWDVFNIGMAKTVNTLYGNVSVAASIIIIIIDIVLKEKIGLGTILDAIVVGKTVDLLNFLNLVGTEHHIAVSIVLMLAGYICEAFGQYLYIKVGLCCGPRDALLVALSRRIKKLPIGAVNTCILLVVLIIGWFLGGPVGIGSIITPFCYGFVQQKVFNLMKFDPKTIDHQSVFGSMKVLAGTSQS